MPELIPLKDEERIAWLNNFNQHFTELAADYSFSVEEVERVKAACETLIFSIELARAAKLFSKVCTIYRNDNFKDKRRMVERVPKFEMPEIPAKLAPTDALRYLQSIVRRVKVQSNYNSVIGLRLGIRAPQQREISREDAKPKIKIVALANSVVRINWMKRNFDGVIVESRRADETAWTKIGTDLSSPFIDTRPPLVAGQPEQRFYRLIYIVKDQPFGNYTEIYNAVTNSE